MPAGTTPKELAKAIRTRSTRTTRALKTLFTNPGNLLADADFPTLDADHALDAVAGQLPPWAQGRLSNGSPSLSPIELDHIGAWPDDQKEDVRKALVKAIRDSLTLTFFWEVYPGTVEATLIDYHDIHGGITIIFRSPESNIRGGDVTVDVNPP